MTTPTKEIADFLGTTDKKEQLDRIRQLTNPVVDVIVRHDLRTNEVSVSVIGADITAGDARGILRMATDVLTQQETRARIEQEAKAAAAPPDSGSSKPRRRRRKKTSLSSAEVSADEGKS